MPTTFVIHHLTDQRGNFEVKFALDFFGHRFFIFFFYQGWLSKVISQEIPGQKLHHSKTNMKLVTCSVLIRPDTAEAFWRYMLIDAVFVQNRPLHHHYYPYITPLYSSLEGVMKTSE